MASPQLLPQHIFGFLSEEQKDVLKNAASTVTYHGGETIYPRETAATHIYVVLEGEVALRLPGSEGMSVLIEQLGPGEIFGLHSTFASSVVYHLTVHAVGVCKLLRIDAAALRHVMDEDPEVGFALQKRISDIYYKRFIITARRLQAIIEAVPLGDARPRTRDWLTE